MDAGTIIGGFAAVCTTLSSLPQLKKCWETGSAGDLSLRMLLLHSTGVALWIGYGVFRGDWVIIISNAVSLGCSWASCTQAAGKQESAGLSVARRRLALQTHSWLCSQEAGQLNDLGSGGFQKWANSLFAACNAFRNVALQTSLACHGALP